MTLGLAHPTRVKNRYDAGARNDATPIPNLDKRRRTAPSDRLSSIATSLFDLPSARRDRNLSSSAGDHKTVLQCVCNLIDAPSRIVIQIIISGQEHITLADHIVAYTADLIEDPLTIYALRYASLSNAASAIYTRDALGTFVHREPCKKRDGIVGRGLIHATFLNQTDQCVGSHLHRHRALRRVCYGFIRRAKYDGR